MTHHYLKVVFISIFCAWSLSSIAEEKAELLKINCENDEQKRCFETELSTIQIDKSLCSTAQQYNTFNLTLLAEKKFPQDETAELNATQDIRKGWIEALRTNCHDQKPFNAKESSSWANQFMVGYAIQSDYNQEGESEGLNRKHAFAQFGFEGRWITDNSRAIHWEIGGLFAGTPVLDTSEQGDSEESEGDDSDANTNAMMDSGDNGDDKVKFNDVTDSLDIYTKVTTSIFSFKDKPMKDYFTAGALAGFKTRDNMTSEQDSVIYYAGGLVEYLYYGKDMSNAENQIPRGKIRLAYLNFEEYGGVKHANRWLLTGEWQLNQSPDAESDEGRFVVGFKANLGKGADDVGIYFAYRSGFDAIRDFLTGG